MNEKRKWAAVYWCLRWYCNFPVKVSEFCERINSLPFSKKVVPECELENIRKLINNYSFMNQDARKMNEVKPKKEDEQFFVICKGIVQALVQELGKAVLPKP